MDKCTYCKKEIEYYTTLDINGVMELCCQDCHDDLRLDWEELKQDR